VEIIKKFISRRLLVLTVTFAAPVVYHQYGVSDTVIMAVIGIAGTYILGRAYSDAKVP